MHCFHSFRSVQLKMQLVSETTGRDRMCWKKGDTLHSLASDNISPAVGGGSAGGGPSLLSIAWRPRARQARAAECLTCAFTRSLSASTASVSHAFNSVKSWYSC